MELLPAFMEILVPESFHTASVGCRPRSHTKAAGHAFSPANVSILRDTGHSAEPTSLSAQADYVDGWIMLSLPVRSSEKGVLTST
jgi:hypothetical protein